MYDILIDLYQKCAEEALQYVDMRRGDYVKLCYEKNLNCDMCWNSLWNTYKAITRKIYNLYIQLKDKVISQTIYVK